MVIVLSCWNSKYSPNMILSWHPFFLVFPLFSYIYHLNNSIDKMFNYIPYYFVKECIWLQNWYVSAANPDFCSCFNSLQGWEGPSQWQRIQMDREWSPSRSLNIPLKPFIRMIAGYYGQTPNSITGLSREHNLSFIETLLILFWNRKSKV